MYRAQVGEMVPTLVLASGVATFLLLVRAVFFLADLFITHGVGPASAMRMLLYSMPNILALTLPIGTLFAVLMTAARWSADSELVAAQACGIRPTVLARPLVGVALLIVLGNGYLTWQVMPTANSEFSLLRRKIIFSAVSAAIQPREFVEDLPGKLIYVDRVDPGDDRWRGVVVFDWTSGTEEQLITANSGRLVANPADGSAVLRLEDTTTHLLQPDRPDSYRINRNQELSMFLRPATGERTDRIRMGPRETPSGELLGRLRAKGTSAEDRLDASVELNKRLAIPAAAFFFALVGFPLGVTNRRGGKGYGLTASVLLIVLYYVLLNNGELLASSGRIPVWLGVWLPNLVLAIAGLFLLRRVARGTAGGTAPAPSVWKGRLQELWKVVSEAVKRVWAKRRRPDPGGATESDAGERPPVAVGAAWPGVLDRYVVRLCFIFLGLVVIAVCALWITVQVSEDLEDIQKNAPPLWVVVSYYFFSLPQIFHDTLPLAFLISFLGTATVLERHNETVALKAAGISVTRAVAPLFILALLLAAGLFRLDDGLTHRANRAAQRLHDIIRGRSVARSYRATDRPWMFLPDGRTLVNFMEYDADTGTLVRPSIFVFDAHMNLRARHMARSATFVDGKWLGKESWSRTFMPDGRAEYVGPRKGLVELPIPVGKDYFGQEFRQAAQLNFRELKEYIDTLQTAGYRVDRLRVELHQKLAYPLSIVLLAWLALPYAFRLGRHGTVMGIALALVLGMIYFMVLAFSTRLGEASLLPPVLASWTPTIVFALLALNRHTTLRT
jgi:LPS export ABC transporter permease LptF/LPS export ABC transporter permease LptG